MEETTATEATTEATAETTKGPGLLTRTVSSIRARLLAWFVVLLAVVGVVSVALTRAVLLDQLDERIDHDLVQETGELRNLARGSDPRTGEPFGDDVRRIFEVYLRRNIPSRSEALITFVDGQPYKRSRPVVPYRLDRDPELVERWASLETTERGTVDTPEGEVAYLAVPVRGDDGTLGVFVVAIFRDLEGADVGRAVAAAGITAAVVALIGSLLAWRVAGKILGPVGVVRDTALSISESDLTRRIDVRGDDEIAVLARAFNQMLDRLEEAFTTQKRFIDDVAHELRTPITIVRGHLELLDDDPRERAHTVELVLEELDRMTRFVDDLLLLARSERPDFLNLSTVDVARLTEGVLERARALGRREWRIDELGRGVVVADAQRLTQALVQLADNAVKHTTESDVVALGSAIRDGHARLWVRDTGRGIPAEDHERIFERFRRSGPYRRKDGAGLGLAIVEAIADAHHGRVEVDSAPGAGARFTVVLPVDQPQIAEVTT